MSRDLKAKMVFISESLRNGEKCGKELKCKGFSRKPYKNMLIGKFRQKAEKLRHEAGKFRLLAEELRQLAEKLRHKAEKLRHLAEDLRLLAE